MIKIRRAIIETIKLVIVFISTLLIFSYGLTLIQNEYQQRLIEFESEREADFVTWLNFFNKDTE